MALASTAAQDDLAIEAQGLYHIYRGAEIETVALRGAELALARGSWASIMGPSGSGKSTLLHVMAGLLEPSGGSVMLDGRDLTRLPPPERAALRRSAIGVVLQRDNLHPLLDASGNLALPLRLGGRPRGEVQARVGQLLDEIGLTDRRRSRPGQLSGGRRSAWRSASRWRRARACCWPTSRPASSTRRRPSACSICSTRFAARRGRRSSP